MNHKLALEVPDTLNTKYIRIIDFSDYNENIPVECPLLEITVPGFMDPVQIAYPKIEKNFVLSLSACDLNLQKLDCDSKKLSLPDGVYIIKYSVSPSDTVYVEYNYLRVSQIMNNYKSILCSLSLDGSEPNSETKEKLDLLNQVKLYIEAAKSKVEVCHDITKGLALYDYAKKLLSKFDCFNC